VRAYEPPIDTPAARVVAVARPTRPGLISLRFTAILCKGARVRPGKAARIR
jgi:hypothetical protein